MIYHGHNIIEVMREHVVGRYLLEPLVFVDPF